MTLVVIMTHKRTSLQKQSLTTIKRDAKAQEDEEEDAKEVFGEEAVVDSIHMIEIKKRKKYLILCVIIVTKLDTLLQFVQMENRDSKS